MTSIGRENLGTVLGTGAWIATLGISPNMVSNIIVQTTISTLLELPQFLMYYCEPGTGQRFHSLICIQKRLSGETSRSAKPGNKEYIQNVPYIFKSRSLFDLPNGWVVERKPCKNIDYAGIIDKHYHELETGKLFRSLSPFESSGSRKEHVSSKKVETAMLDPSSIPAKIKWVLGGPGGIVWNPFMDDHLVPGFIKQKWSETFVLSIIDRL
ncbi:METHYL-CPG-BINDING DOMAIN-CONTAINING PROTEIN 7 [Salix koriyanagi]|uniref:METHYL-CPG-BINDING DOMAIN-CONTAINING PROTEIN 7 n=1 Tax=Salix koriyanagi TaxID=2511006 RepID=A0A9Q0TQH8_9ROSI|nr:METHYL-CPG-BINDING DOMAIN-CONTAINING PROTEIN 7 [Salix koriyanagi]